MTSYKRAIALAAVVAALAAVPLAGCRAGNDRAGVTNQDQRPGTSAGTGTSTTTPGGATGGGSGGTSAQVDGELSTVDGLLGQLDGQLNKADQAPQDGDG
jgi:hypothetical protein